MFGLGRRRPDRIDATEALRRTSETQDAILLDVREPDEWYAGHAPNATLVPLSSFDPQGPLPYVSGDRPVVLICRSGHRSQQAAAFYTERGVDAVDVTGGMIAWAGAGHPVVDEQGNPGSII